MKLKEAQQKFIHEWGALATKWGINKTMAQIHALLITSSNSLTTDEIMGTLQISRGNANTNIRALVDWGIVYKDIQIGDRKDYYYAEKDIWKMAGIIAKERKKREINPVIQMMENLMEEDIEESEGHEFKETLKDLHDFVSTMSNAFDKAANQKSWMSKALLKLIS